MTEANLRESTESIESTSLQSESQLDEDESQSNELSKPELISRFNQLNQAMELQKSITDKQEKLLNEILAFILKVSESDGNYINKLKDEASKLLMSTNDSISQLEELILKSNDGEKSYDDIGAN